MERRDQQTRQRMRRAAIDDERRSRVLDSGDAATLRSALASEATRAAARRVPGQHPDRDHEVHARPARARARPRWLLPRAAEDAGRRGREPRRRRVADQRRQAVLRLLDGAPVRRGRSTTTNRRARRYFPRLAMAQLLFDYKPGWDQTIEYRQRRSAPAGTRCASSTRRTALYSTLVAPLMLGGKNLGWITLCARRRARGRIMVAHRAGRGDRAARGAGAASRAGCSSRSALEERRKAILEERNRLARDIHDNLAQGFGAILMQLQAAQREGTRCRRRSRAASTPPSISRARTWSKRGDRSAHFARTSATARTSRRRSSASPNWRRRRQTSRSRSTSTSCRALAMVSSARSSASRRKRSPTPYATRARSASRSAHRR